MYVALTEEEQDDIMAAFILSQEQDHYTHTVNLERYEKMLQDMPHGKWKERIEQLKAQIEERLAEVNSIIAASATQIPPEQRLQAALTRIRAKDA